MSHSAKDESEKLCLVEEDRALSWQFHSHLPSFMLSSQRWQRIHQNKDGSISVSSDITFHGMIRGLVIKLHGQDIYNGFTEMQMCLKAEALKRAKSESKQ